MIDRYEFKLTLKCLMVAFSMLLTRNKTQRSVERSLRALTYHPSSASSLKITGSPALDSCKKKKAHPMLKSQEQI